MSETVGVLQSSKGQEDMGNKETVPEEDNEETEVGNTTITKNQEELEAKDNQQTEEQQLESMTEKQTEVEQTCKSENTESLQRTEMEEIKEELKETEGKPKTKKEEVKVELKDYLKELEQELKTEMWKMKTELEDILKEAEGKPKTKKEEVKVELKYYLKELEQELKTEMWKMKTELEYSLKETEGKPKTKKEEVKMELKDYLKEMQQELNTEMWKMEVDLEDTLKEAEGKPKTKKEEVKVELKDHLKELEQELKTETWKMKTELEYSLKETEDKPKTKKEEVKVELKELEQELKTEMWKMKVDLEDTLKEAGKSEKREEGKAISYMTTSGDIKILEEEQKRKKKEMEENQNRQIKSKRKLKEEVKKLVANFLQDIDTLEEEEERIVKEMENIHRKKARAEIEFKLKEEFERHMNILEVEDKRLKKEMEENQKKKQDIENRLKLKKKRLKQLEEGSTTALDLALQEESEIFNKLQQERSQHRKRPLQNGLSSGNRIYPNPSNKRPDLSKWKSSKFRSITETSCDVDLLEACSQEIQRRLKVYRALKQTIKNSIDKKSGCCLHPGRENCIREGRREGKEVSVKRLEVPLEGDMKEEEPEDVLPEEEEKSLRKEMEEKERKKGELERRRKLEELLKLSEELSATYRKEGQDLELVLRLVNENSKRKVDQNQNSSNKKYDLSNWKYSELRDKIKTFSDTEFLEACSDEFHRRLKVYHAWKAKSIEKASERNEAVPKATTQPDLLPQGSVQSRRVNNVTTALNNSQRYFRIPFAKAGFMKSGNKKGKKGWWYAHFDGQQIARQMEIHPDKQAILLVAGVDDMQMCELSLEETGLARKKGAEILEHEFDKEWVKNGGKLYVRLLDREN